MVAFTSVCADGVNGGVSAGALRWLLVAASPENTENIEEVRRTEEGRGEDGWEAGKEKEKGKGPFLSPVSKRTVRCILGAYGF